MAIDPSSSGPQRSRSRHRRRRNPVLALWIVAALLAGGLGIFFLVRPGSHGQQGRAHPAVKLPLDEVELRSLNNPGETVLTDDLRGRVTVLNFWGTWCPPCRVELPHLAELGRKYRRYEKFQLLAVSCSGGQGDEDFEALREETLDFVAGERLDLPTYADEHYGTRTGAKRSAAFDDRYPTTIVLDEQVKIRGVWWGYAPGVEAQIEALVHELLLPLGDRSPEAPRPLAKPE